MKRLLVFILSLLAVTGIAQTHVYFDLSEFGAVPTTNRPVTLQLLSPFQGNLRQFSSDSSGTFYFSNAPLGVYQGYIKAPPAQIPFKIYVVNTNQGIVDAYSITVADATATFPAGSVAWSANVSDQRYPRSTNFSTAGLQSGSQNLTNWSGVNTNQYATTNQIPNVAILQTGNQNLTNWSGVNTNQYATTNQLPNVAILQTGSQNLTNWSSLATNVFVNTSLIPTFQPSSVNLSNWSSVATNLFARTNQLPNVALFQPASSILTNIATTGANTNQIAAGTNIVFTTNAGTITISSTASGTGSGSGISTNGGTGTNNIFTNPQMVFSRGLFGANNVLDLSFPGAWTLISGGQGNWIGALADATTISGGQSNRINSGGSYGTISGGFGNLIAGAHDGNTIAGGKYNYIDALDGFVAGNGNQLTWNIFNQGSFAIGMSNGVNRSHSAALGTFAFAQNVGTFVWADNNGGTFASAADNQFIIRAQNGVGINTNNAGTNGLRVVGVIDSTAGFTVRGSNVFVSVPTNSGSDGYVVSKAGLNTKYVDILGNITNTILANTLAEDELTIVTNTDRNTFRVNTNMFVMTNSLVAYSNYVAGVFVQTNAGTALSFTSQSNNFVARNISMSANPSFTYTTNVIAIYGSGNVTNNVTYVWNGSYYTNTTIASSVVFNNPVWNNINQAGVIQYSASSINGTWNIVNGNSPAPTSGSFGYYFDLRGAVFQGEFGQQAVTNLPYQISNVVTLTKYDVSHEYVATAYGATNSSGGETTAALQALLSIPGARVRIPYDSAGYTIGNLHVTNGVTLINEGSILQAKSNLTGVIIDTHNNTNIFLKGLMVKGLTSSNYLNMVPSWIDILNLGTWYNNEGTLRGINCNMDGNIFEDCVVYDTSGSAFFLYNVHAGNSENFKLSTFRGNQAINSYVGLNLNSLTNVAPASVAEYNLISGFNATGCLYGGLKGSGNNRIENSDFSHNGVGVMLTGGNNGAHGLTTVSLNHCVYPAIIASVSAGEHLVSCNIMANTGPIIVDASAGVVFDQPQFNQPVSIVITNSRAGVITTGTVILRNGTYYGLYKDWTIYNSEGGSKFIHYGNYSSDNPGDHDYGAMFWPKTVWPLRSAFPLGGSFNDNSHGPSGSSIWANTPCIQFGTNTGGFVIQLPCDPNYTNTVTRFDFIGGLGTSNNTNCTFVIYATYRTNGATVHLAESGITKTFSLMADTNTTTYYTNFWPDRFNPRQIQVQAINVPGDYGSTNFWMVHAETEGRN